MDIRHRVQQGAEQFDALPENVKRIFGLNQLDDSIEAKYDRLFSFTKRQVERRLALSEENKRLQLQSGAERKRGLREALSILDAESQLSAPCWCQHDEDTGITKTCDCCNFIANVRDKLTAALTV